MPIKMHLPDNSPKNKRRMVTASGAYNVNTPNTKTGASGYAHSDAFPMTLSKSAQAISSNVMMTQPMFFSPLHTPQNWQVPARRLEIYQWSFISPCFLTTYGDFSLISIDSAVDIINNKNNLYIQNGNGDKSLSDKATKRFVKKQANTIKILGVAEPLCVTNDHDCMIIKKEDVKCRSSNSKNCVTNYKAPSCISAKCSKYINKDYNISKVKAKDVKKGDFVLVPFNTTIKNSIIKSEDEARFAGHLASDGSIDVNSKSTYIYINRNEIEAVNPCIDKVFSNFGVYKNFKNGCSSNLVSKSSSNRKLFKFASSLVKGVSRDKKFTEEVMLLDPKLQLHVLGAYIQSDGHYNKKNRCVEITTYSMHLANQLVNICYRCNILARVNKQPISRSKGTFSTKNTHRYLVHISSSDCYKIAKYVPEKLKKHGFEGQRIYNRFFWKNFVVSPVVSNDEYAYEGYVYDIREPETFTLTANGISVYQCRFYYTSAPKVAAGVDFYSNFSQNGFKLECTNLKVLHYYEQFIKKIELAAKLNDISHEYFLIGDVFPFLEIECSHCGGQNILPDGTRCNHPDGTFKSLKVLNPDYIEVKTNPLADFPQYYLVPDDELRIIIQRREPKIIYDMLPKKLIDLVLTGQPIPLSDRSVSHIKHNASPYGIYGTSLLQRLFTVLAYQTKLMTANWIVAERLIIPIRIVKIGEKDRPATDADIQDIMNSLAAVTNDPNLTIVTHHAFEAEWIGASGKIHNITAELELVGKEILDGLMLNQAILSGEMVGYNSAQVGIEILIRRLDNWRNKLQDWVEKHIFLPIAMMQGFIDEESSKELGEVVYQYPQLVWNDLQLRDKTNKIQTMMQLYDKGIVSAESILDELDLDYNVEVEKIRNEQVLASASGMLPPGGGNVGTMGMGGGADMGGGMGGAPVGEPMGGGMGAGGAPVPGAPGGEVGGMGGGMGGMGMGAAAEGNALPKIGKRGAKPEEFQGPPPKMIKFTKLEQQMYKMLRNLNVPYPLFAQYEVKISQEQRPYVIDFAYPKIGVGIESDGDIFHQREDFIQRDQMRDQKLANVGWRILRFKEAAINNSIDAVQDVISKNIIDAAKSLKKKSDDENGIKYASVNEYLADFDKEEIFFNVTDLPNNLGESILIGTLGENK